MKCAIILLCVVAAHGFTMMSSPMMYGLRGATYSMRTGMPMSFLRKRRDAEDKDKSVAIHVANRGLTYPYAGFGYSGLNYSPFMFRKKRDVDQQADAAALYYTTPFAGFGYSSLNYSPFIFRKKRDVDQQADAAALYYTTPYAGFGYSSLSYSPFIFRKKRDADQQADAATLYYSPISTLGYSAFNYPFYIRK